MSREVNEAESLNWVAYDVLMIRRRTGSTLLLAFYIFNTHTCAHVTELELEQEQERKTRRKCYCNHKMPCY